MFECPTPLSGNQEFIVDRSRSFNFGSRSQLRRISPKEILASEFVFRHFVVVYLKHRPSKTEFYVAVMSNNSNNDLGNLKIAKLHEKGPNKVTYLTTLHLQIICAHWEVLSIKLVFLWGFDYRTFKKRKHSKSGYFGVWLMNGPGFKYFTRWPPTIENWTKTSSFLMV